MIKFFKLIPYHFNNACKSIYRNLAMSFSSATAVSVTLLLVMLFLVIAVNLSSVSDKIEKSVQIFVQIDNIVSEEEYDAIEESIKSIENVTVVEYSNKEEQFDLLVADEQAGSEYELLREENPLLNAFYVDITSGEHLEAVNAEVLEIEGVYNSDYGGTSANYLMEAFETIRLGGGLFVVILCFLAIFLISNTIKITIHSRSDEIAIMRHVGADNTFIKMPFMMEGMMIGLIGSIAPILILVFGYQYLYNVLGGNFFSSLLEMQSPTPFVLYASLTLLGLGALVGMVGSFLSVNKYVKWKR